jgi:hypothetical protein
MEPVLSRGWLYVAETRETTIVLADTVLLTHHHTSLSPSPLSFIFYKTGNRDL